MIATKRKNESTQIKSKQKSKPNKQQKQTKKKKQTIEKAQKLKPTASKKQLKLHNQDKQLNQEVFYQNENQNKSNIPSHLLTHHHKVKAQLCQEIQADVQYVNMRRSASVGGLKGVRPVRKSLSPGLSKEKEKADIRQKYSSKPTSRSEKQKLRQPGHGLEKAKSTLLKKHVEAQKQQKQKITRKKSQKQIKNTSQRLKTENSSKIPQGKQKQQKMERISQRKKSSKVIKIKPILKTSTSKMKLKTIKAKEVHKSSVVFSEVSFHDNSPLYSAIMPKQNFYVKMEKNQQNKVLNACITIQKHFRGYLTRKYIQETKYMIYSIIKIQKVWRGYCCRKKLRRQEPQKKNLSIQNSLITIKDFSEEPKQQRLKNKSFKFSFEDQGSKKKQQKGEGSSLKKSRNDDGEEKYINILEALLLEEGLDEKFKDKIRSTLGKEKYVQQKIYSEIVSEKSFNSPRQLRSPKANLVLNSPSSWSKHKQISQSLQNFCTSPRNNEVSETLNKRINSPLQSKSGLNSSRRLNTEQKIEVNLQVKPIQTSFEFIEEFQLRIVDYLRDNSQIKENFLSTCQKCQQFRTYLVMSQWNIDREYEAQYFSFLQSDICPDIFPKEFREEIISENSMKIYLQDNNYLDSLWISNSIQRSIYQGYLKCIFDSLAEAIYDSYKSQIITRKSKNAICYFQGHELFKLIFMNSLTLMQGWNEYMCGAQIPVNEGEPNYKQYCEKNNERLEIMIKNSVVSDQFKEQGSVALWIELAISEAVYEDLMSQFYNEFFV